MARSRRAPYLTGDTLEVRAPRGSTVHVEAPNGLQLAMPGPAASVWLAQPGEWRYRIGDGEWVTVSVVDPPAADDAPPVGIVEPG